MKQGMSSLNPYAASYVPLSKRKAHRATSVTGTAASFQGPPQHIAEDQHLLHSRTVPEAFQVKGKPASSSYGLSQQNVAGLVDNQFPDEDPDMDIEFLRMQFPGISEQSLRDVYVVNECDLDAAVEMLNQLELRFDGVESSGSLPETLDIGDVSFSESGSSADSTTSKLKNVAAGASTSSSSSASSNSSANIS